MQQRWNMGNVGGVWLAPALLGVALIVFGVLIFVVPKLLELIVAAAFIFAGCALLGLAWHMRGRITYRRLDDQEPRDL
jgi:protein-S-isoprenylcysteine O-methyltransferase Ste14